MVPVRDIGFAVLGVLGLLSCDAGQSALAARAGGKVSGVGAVVQRLAPNGASSAGRPLLTGALLPQSPVFTLAPVTVVPEPDPLSGLGRGALAELIQNDPAHLGSMAAGQPNRGALINGVPIPEDRRWRVMVEERSWGTAETVRGVTAAVARVAAEHAGSPPLNIGDLSLEHGGRLRPHRSHQSGLDADIGFYYRDDSGWYTRGNAQNLDLERTWSLLKALVASGNVEYVFLDRSIQELLKDHIARTDDVRWVDELFEVPGSKHQRLVRHTWGHQTHLHVRFFSRRAQETAQLTYKLLAQLGKL